jgi:1-acyl-sn-glycerol-3-phosphate acyltransferase
MLDISRIKRIRLTRRPLAQRFTGQFLRINYNYLPGIKNELAHAERLPKEPVIFAMNHTDRYNYFPFQVLLWQTYDRFTATWVKGKYYENSLLAGFMEKTNQLPTVSRGYIITKDFAATVGRSPSSDEYEALRDWVNAASVGNPSECVPSADLLPEPLLARARNVLGHAFDPEKDDYPSYVNTIFGIMMRHFVELNEQVPRIGLDMLIFPQGTRSMRLLPAHIGISQIALHLKLPVVPVGCNGTDQIYPGSSPFAKKGHAVYRIGEPIHYESIPEFHIGEDYEPFSSDSEQRHRERFEGFASMLTERIDELLDPEYRLLRETASDAASGSDRFI